MDTKDRQYLRETAYTMEATYRDDAKGLAQAQKDARNVVAGLRGMMPGEDDDTLCCAARMVCRVVAALAKTPVAFVGEQMQGMCAAYPLAAGNLAGVYVLPAAPEPEGKPAAESPQDKRDGTGFYL